MPPWRAIAWDMDGTLLDTEPMHRTAHIEQCRSLGLSVSDERIDANVGPGDEDFYRQLLREAGRQDPGRAAGLKMAQEEQRLFAALPSRAGASSSVEALWPAARHGRRQCLVTASRAPPRR